MIIHVIIHAATEGEDVRESIDEEDEGIVKMSVSGDYLCSYEMGVEDSC